MGTILLTEINHAITSIVANKAELWLIAVLLVSRHINHLNWINHFIVICCIIRASKWNINSIKFCYTVKFVVIIFATANVFAFLFYCVVGRCYNTSRSSNISNSLEIVGVAGGHLNLTSIKLGCTLIHYRFTAIGSIIDASTLCSAEHLASLVTVVSSACW